ncbi:MAG: recombinase family protein [Rickettsiales bacterium]|nr:MAG: recombinase family protein [Rickettsiales bacterium]
MLIGYARVSKKDDQDNTAQINILKSVGCSKIFQEEASGGRWDRPELHKMIEHIREGDIVVVWKLDRLSRSLKDLLHIIDKFRTMRVGFKSITEEINTTTPAGVMMMHMLGSFAEFERAMIRERTLAGLKSAKEKGKKLGPPQKLNDVQREEIIRMVMAGEKSGVEAARLFNVNPSTVSKIVVKYRANQYDI